MTAGDGLDWTREPPLQAMATVVQQRSERVYLLRLPNGKLTHGHIPRREADAIPSLGKGDTVRVEITPYDFDRARIAAKIKFVEEEAGS